MWLCLLWLEDYISRGEDKTAAGWAQGMSCQQAETVAERLSPLIPAREKAMVSAQISQQLIPSDAWPCRVDPPCTTLNGRQGYSKSKLTLTRRTEQFSPSKKVIGMLWGVCSPSWLHFQDSLILQSLKTF